MRQKLFLSLVLLIATGVSVLAIIQFKDVEKVDACSKCNCPKNKCIKTENPYLDPFNHLIARL